jgi:predicted phage terminase large subunit-like protein
MPIASDYSDIARRAAALKTGPAAHELALLQEIQRRRRCRGSFLAWCTEALAPLGQTPAAHHRLLIEELQAAADGEIDRLMIFMPPGHAKSRYASVLFPGWFLGQEAGQDVIGASYNADLAEDFSGQIMRLAQENATTLGFSLVDESRKLWHTSNRGTYRAAGAGGGITGRRADLFLIDDPIRGREDADSSKLRDRVWKWYQAEVVTRLKPGARIVLIQTRWHEDDLAGRLLAAAETGGDTWRVVNLPAIAETEDDALGRSIGDALWPEWEDVAMLERKRAAIGEREWAALFQQRPRPLEGSLFKIAAISLLEAAPAGGTVVRAWDLAATALTGTRDPDWTVGVKLQRQASGQFTVLDVRRLRGGPDEVERMVVNTAHQDGDSVRISIPQDPGQAGKQQVLYLGRKLSGFRVESSPETGDKATRAAPIAAQVNIGNVSMVRAAWNIPFLEELAGFPSSAHDDQVDALSRAFAMVGMGAGPLVISADLLAASRQRR